MKRNYKELSNQAQADKLLAEELYVLELARKMPTPRAKFHLIFRNSNCDDCNWEYFCPDCNKSLPVRKVRGNDRDFYLHECSCGYEYVRLITYYDGVDY